MEKEKEAMQSQLITKNTPPQTPGEGGHLLPKELDFTTPPQQQRRSARGVVPATPTTPATTPGSISDIESLSMSSGQTGSSMTPEMSKLSLGKTRGRPRKTPSKPTLDDFPHDASKEEQQRYVKKINTQMWRYKKLMGAGAPEFRQAELDRVKQYHAKKKQEKAMDEESEEEHKKKLSRAR